MRDPAAAYRGQLENMSALVKAEEYAGCFNVAKNLTNFGWTLELKDEVFISEVSEALLGEMDELSHACKIPREKREEIKNELVGGIEELISAHAEKNPAELHRRLRDLRCSATFHQFHVWQKYQKTVGLA